MVIDECPHCGVRHVQTQARFQEPLWTGDGRVLWAVERCQNPTCLRLVLVVTDQGAIQHVYPVAMFQLESTAPIPQEIRDDFREAGLCLGSGCYKASLVMSRRVLQRCLLAQGCTQSKLVEAIDHAVAKGILRKAFHQLAEETRQYGNLGAHPDDDQLANANRESAHQVLEFARLLIHEFYELPATAAQLKQRREGYAT